MEPWDKVCSIQTQSSQYLTFFFKKEELKYNVFGCRDNKPRMEPCNSVQCVVFTLRKIADDLERKYETIR